MSINSSGHVAAALRAKSYFSQSDAVKEKVNGLRFYSFVENLEKNFELEKENLANQLVDIIKKIIRSDNLLVSYTGDSAGLEIVKNSLVDFKAEIDRFCSETISNYKDIVFLS